MGERVYSVNRYELQFSETSGDNYGCLCTFPGNDISLGIDIDRVRSLALLGAAVCLAVEDELEHGLLPDAVPTWIREQIDDALGIRH